jgi:hypothetical protein
MQLKPNVFSEASSQSGVGLWIVVEGIGTVTVVGTTNTSLKITPTKPPGEVLCGPDGVSLPVSPPSLSFAASIRGSVPSVGRSTAL